jgi:exopolysaccharide biosynthesis protein
LGRKDIQDDIHNEPAYVNDEINLTRVGRKKRKGNNKKRKAKHTFVAFQILICLVIAWFFLPGLQNVVAGEFTVFEDKKLYFKAEPTPSPTQEPTPEPTQTPEPAPTSEIGEPISTVAPTPTPSPTPFEGVVITEKSYRSENVDIKVEKISEKNVTFYVADIKIKNMSYIKTGDYRNDNNQLVRRSVVKTARQHDAIVAINTDYYTYRDSGNIIRNGKVIINDGWGDVLCIFADGRMEVYNGFDYTAYELVEMGVIDSFTFGPILIRDGALIEENLRGNSLKEVKHPRTGIGYYSPGHYLFVTVDGRKEGYSEGMKLTQFANLFLDRGCNMAYNLDGGGSTTMAFMGKLVNRPEGTENLRDVDGILYIWDEAYPEDN